jgi:hypothetical protein
MKELSIEEKAKRYEDALGRARTFYKRWYGVDAYNSSLAISELKEIFPELFESDDERIRKAILIYLDWLDGRKDYAPKGEYCIRDMIAWLEKQGKQNTFDYKNTNIQQKDFAPKSALEAINEEKVDNTDNVEPKFKVGDWVVQGCNILRIRCVGDKYYCYETIGGYVDDMLVSEMDSLYHLWTIEDAKRMAMCGWQDRR